MNVETLDPRAYIIIKGAKENNLKNVDIALPRNKFIVVTGVSGSGKSSIVFDTLFSEGQRMYVESLSAYVRQFLGRMQKPAVDYIKGISPAIAIEQRTVSKSTSSTVGTATEIYDYFKLLFTHIGRTYSPISGKEVTRDTVASVVNYIFSKKAGTRFIVTFSQSVNSENWHDSLEILMRKGYSKIFIDSSISNIEDTLELSEFRNREVPVVVYRNKVKHEESEKDRLAGSLEMAFFEGKGMLSVFFFDEAGGCEEVEFSDKFEADGITFQEPSIHFFSFNNPLGVCTTCQGKSKVYQISKKLVIPLPHLSIAEGAIAPWKGVYASWRTDFVKAAKKIDFPVHRSYELLDEEQKKTIWRGNSYFRGLNEFFNLLEKKQTAKAKITMAKYKSYTDCRDCMTTRIRHDASYVKINDISIMDMLLMPISDLILFFKQIQLTEYEQQVSKVILQEIRSRLSYLEKVGLSYLTLNRASHTLSGGEFQRVKLTNSLGSALVGSMYILDEPSIGLHPRDTQNLISILRSLTDLGNTVIVVEHEEDIIKSADEIIDIGPDAGTYGGELVAQGNLKDIEKNSRSYTGQYLTGKKFVPIPKERRTSEYAITLENASCNNLKNLTVNFPLQVLTVVTGVSGSGKSSLVYDELYSRLQAYFDYGSKVGLAGDIEKISGVEFIGQRAIPRTSRSSPVTYLDIYQHIRKLFLKTKEAKQQNLTLSHFSVNSVGGRCEECQGVGKIKVEMQFMADVFLTCEVCQGNRFSEEVLGIEYNGKNITQTLDLTIEEAIVHFNEHDAIALPLKMMKKVGLSYLQLGQSCSLLSGGELQRLKLVSFMAKKDLRTKKNILFIFDEPSTGLHFHDIEKLLIALQSLIEQGNHTVVIIEHNKEIIKNADWIIDVGPDGGDKGGWICYEGIPENMVRLKNNLTAQYLRDKLD